MCHGAPDVSQAAGEANDPCHDAPDSTAAFDRRHLAEDALRRHALEPGERISLRHEVGRVTVDHPVQRKAPRFGGIANDVADADPFGTGANDGHDVAVAKGWPHAGAARAKADTAGPFEGQT
jgi:hypothetical protein